ncbi:hypothetical protein SLEP1_g19278 [Rubroshorea leprosula]|nr:hypothetical protein SLEP1_g19278 [Rubroshorea leprosula]
MKIKPPFKDGLSSYMKVMKVKNSKKVLFHISLQKAPKSQPFFCAFLFQPSLASFFLLPLVKIELQGALST